VRILVVNAGSSSLKLRLLGEADDVLASVDLDAPRGVTDVQSLAGAVEGLGRADAVGHRIVHGGTRFKDAVRIDAGVVQALGELVDLAPLHQPKSLAALDAVSRVLPDVPAVACFDTAFHTTLPAAASTYALPQCWRDEYALRRYGFHGLSHAYAARRGAELIGRPPDQLRLVTCHLGAGASLAAVRGGVSVDTTMGFTPLDGLVMATRSGSVDPGMLIWLLEHSGLEPREVGDALEHASGLAGLAGRGDMREVLALAAGGDQRAALALDVYVHRLRASIAAMAAAMDGLDALVFTGGVGENAPEVRERAAAGLGFLGVELDLPANASTTGDGRIGSPSAAVGAVVVTAREDVEIARQVRALL
jgi:acetate kinase